MELGSLENTEVARKEQGSIVGNPSDSRADLAAGGKGRKAIAEKLVDELTDYICAHVTKSLKPIQAVIEKKIIIRALQETGGSQKKAAKILGIKYTTLIYKVKKHKIYIKKMVSAGRDLLSDASGGNGEKG